MGQCDGFLAQPISLLIICHARQLEWVKSIDSIVSVHLFLRFLLSLVKNFVVADAFFVLDVAFVWICSRSSHLLSQHRMWLALYPLGMCFFFLAESNMVLYYTS